MMFPCLPLTNGLILNIKLETLFKTEVKHLYCDILYIEILNL